MSRLLLHVGSVYGIIAIRHRSSLRPQESSARPTILVGSEVHGDGLGRVFNGVSVDSDPHSPWEPR